MFDVALTADFFGPDGQIKFADVGLSIFDDQPHIIVRRFADHRPQIGADQVCGANGVIVLTPQVTQDTVSQAEDLLAVGRFGVGYDSVDVAACTAADVLVLITVGAVDRPRRRGSDEAHDGPRHRGPGRRPGAGTSG